jgi:putative heme-binding domain-containing protein
LPLVLAALITTIEVLSAADTASSPDTTSFPDTASFPEQFGPPRTLEQQLRQTDTATLAKIARDRGDASRGAFVYHTSPAGCVNCHLQTQERSPLGPDLDRLGPLSDEQVIESLLYPSRSIRKGYETVSILTTEGKQWLAMRVREDDNTITVRLASDLQQDYTLDKSDVDAIRASELSMMPEGLVASFREQRDFMDLARYLMEVASGGPSIAEQLRPSPESIKARDDTVDLDHAGILKGLRERDFEAGERIFQGYCADCHGKDGNTPSLPTARAFGTQRLKFGSDPYRMFLTLSHGAGLMAPMRHLTPFERYQVVHYIREKFVKPSGYDEVAIDDAYIAGLPQGTRTGAEVPIVERDFGPALGSQLRRDYPSVLNVRLNDITISYDLHTMNIAGLWTGGFLDLSETHHIRDRGEGTANPKGKEIGALAVWQWGHDGTLDYSREGLLPRGPLPDHWMSYRGYYRFENEIVLDYQIDGRPVLESPSTDQKDLVQRLQVGPGKQLRLALADRDSAALVNVTIAGDSHGLTWEVDDQQRLVLSIPESQEWQKLEIRRRVEPRDGDAFANVRVAMKLQQTSLPWSLTSMQQGGPLLWPQVMETVGFLGLETRGYALDTLTIPDQTPWKTWFRTSALDFFPDGRMVLATYGGDIWIISGIDHDLKSLRWKRFAAGLYEPFGVKVVDGLIYVTCKDRLTRLHDVNQDGEADFYENFSSDSDVSINFHAFNFDLQTDNEGHFYYAKSGHGGDSDLPGAVMKISRDGKKREVFCTGFRTPNGMGMLPDGRPLASDNQGQWMPASKINLLKPGGYYGWVQTYSVPGKWSPGGGKIDLDTVVPPSSFDEPMIWMPQDFDNSSGGQLWVDDARFGPLSGKLLHTSFGKGWMSYLMTQEIDGTMQGAITKLPLNFRTGIMRARVNPADGQVYTVGLQGWNGSGRIGLLDGGVQRVRYTGSANLMIVDCQVEQAGLVLKFNAPLDVPSSTDVNHFDVLHWNYQWRREYGSDMYSPATGQVGPERLKVESVRIGSDQRSLFLQIPGIVPVDQLQLKLRVKSAEGDSMEEGVYWTIHRVPEAQLGVGEAITGQPAQ